MKFFKMIGLLAGLCVMALQGYAQSQKMKLLVFTKTSAFRHESIDAGIKALSKMGADKGFAVTFTENAELFNEPNLRKYNAVVFMNTTGDVLNNEQQIAFERYIQAGGGYVGIHAATDTEYDWPWYGMLAGAYFLSHPSTPSNVQKGKFTVAMKDHWATKGMPDEFERMDEFYSFKNISPKINVLLTLDDKSFIGGANPDYHPISWFQDFDGGRSFYTGMGHTDETFTEPIFLNHLWAGIQYAAGGESPKSLDFTKSRPEENRFSKVILAEKLDEPMELSVLNDGRVLFIQRKGEVRLYNSKTKELKTIARLPVSVKYVSKEGKESMGEDGLLGLSKDPDFAKNNWIYLYYSDPNESKNVLARFDLKGDELVMDSKKVMLDIPTQREECCHTGGSIAWDKSGNLYLSTGDNTNPHGSNGFSPSDERDGRSAWDAQKSSANTNDLRGKIIRIKPQPDGTYTIPDGNLFAKGTAQTRPEIYTMGHRNPFRISVDQKTGYLYWGEVGPDAAKPDSSRGPAGHDEVGQARKAGNFGWPHFVGDNKAYNKFDFVKEKSGERWKVEAPANTSPNNTGLQTLPAAEKAFIWYPYDASPEFPLVGAGGRNAMAGPVFYAEDFKNAARSFPKYYDGKLLTYDWMRGWIMSVTMDKDGNYKSMERFMPSYSFSNPMDMEFAENGDLYMLEYGSGWFSANDDARLIHIEYNGGNRKPRLQLAANKMGGSVPFQLKLTSKGTEDPDGDNLSYSWKISSKNGFIKMLNTPDADLTLTKTGVYKATLTVKDGKGASAYQSVDITVGNESPVLDIVLSENNKSFFSPGKDFGYEVKVNDKEDGSLGKGIDPESVALNIDYLAEGYDKVAIAQGHQTADAGALLTAGKKLIEASDCKACHSVSTKSIGPSYTEIAKKYKGDQSAVERLTKKVIAGGGGVWGETPMAAHPQLSTADASEMVKYITSLSSQKTGAKSLPLQGTYTAKLPDGDKGKGVFIVRAAYEDKGAKGLPSLKSEKTVVLHNAKVDVHGFDIYENVNKMSFGGNNLSIPSRSGAYMGMKQMNMKGIHELLIMAMAPKAQLNAKGGKITLHLDSPTGKVIGESDFLEASDKSGFTPTPLKIKMKAESGIDDKPHDLYLVFTNPNEPTGSLMVVMGTEFVLGK